jgi:VCBS repeat-containing protein
MQDAILRPNTPKILAIVDPRVKDYPHLLQGVRSGIDAIGLDPNRDGIEQITEALARSENVTELHIISHGSPGRLQLGNGFLDLETIDRYIPQLRQGFGAIENILLYGCHVAAGDAGSEFIEKLSELTGANIAASASLTGSSALGGDWNLEVRTGEMDVVLALEEETISSYTGVFVTAVNDTGAKNANEVLTVPLPGVLANDTGSGTLTASLLPGVTTSTKGAAISVATNGSYTYNPVSAAVLRALPQGITTTDTFNYQVSDEAPSIALGTVTITVTGVNDAPTPTNDTATIAASGVLNGSSLLVNDTDPDTGETASLTAVAASFTTTQGATVTINTNGTYVYDPRNSATLTGLPDGATAVDTFNYTVRDLNGATATGSASITVTGGNELPSAADDTASTLTNTPVTINILTNDSDPDGNPINLFPLPFNTTSAFGGSVSSGTGISNLIYTPPTGFSGTDTFTYTITDGTSSDTATVTIDVRQPPPPNNLPIAANDTLTITQGTTVPIDVLANDSDPDGDTLTLVSFTNPNSGGTLIRDGNTLTYTPPANFIGNDGFQYIVQDSQGGRSTGGVFIAVLQEGTPPPPPPGPDPGETPACDILLPTPTPPAANITLDTLQGTASDNLLLGNNTSNDVLGLDGGDLIVGLAGNDNLSGNEADDLIFGNQGNDFLQGGDGNDEMFGGRDNDFLDGNLGDDTIAADLGNDSVLGNDGNDVIDGGQGNDVIDGGLGNDAIEGGSENDAIKGSEGNDSLSGGSGADALTGELGADVLYGNGDGDVLDGCSGSDTVFGGLGDDTLFGGTGNDYVDGNMGNNLVFGGAGSDRFALSLSDGTDSIADFVAGEDTLLLTGGLTIEDIAIVPLTNATGLSLVNSQGTFLAVLLGVNSETIGLDNFS